MSTAKVYTTETFYPHMGMEDCLAYHDENDELVHGPYAKRLGWLPPVMVYKTRREFVKDLENMVKHSHRQSIVKGDDFNHELEQIKRLKSLSLEEFRKVVQSSDFCCLRHDRTGMVVEHSKWFQGVNEIIINNFE